MPSLFRMRNRKRLGRAKPVSQASGLENRDHEKERDYIKAFKGIKSLKLYLPFQVNFHPNRKN